MPAIREYSPSQFEAHFRDAERRYRLPEGLLRAIAKVESGFDPGAISPGGDRGLMQFSPATAAREGFDPMNWRRSIQEAGEYLREELDAGLPMSAAVAAYNVGRASALRGGGRGYIEKVVVAEAERQLQEVQSAGIQPVRFGGGGAFGGAWRELFRRFGRKPQEQAPRRPQPQEGTKPKSFKPGRGLGAAAAGAAALWFWPENWDEELRKYVNEKAVPIVLGGLIVTVGVWRMTQ